MRRDIANALGAYQDARQASIAARHDLAELAHRHADGDDREELADAEQHARHTQGLEHRAWLCALAAAAGQDPTAMRTIRALAETHADHRPILADGVARHGVTGRAA